MEKVNIVIFHPADTDKAEKCVEHALTALKDEYQFVNAQSERKATSKKAEFMDILKQSKNQIMMAWMGGLGKTQIGEPEMSGSSIELVHDLGVDDWGTIRQQRPIIIGSSDITYLLNEFLDHDVNCFYGPNFKSTMVDTCDTQREVTIKYMKMALESKSEYCINWDEPELNPEGVMPWILRSGKETGRLIGGNLSTLVDCISLYPDHWVIPRNAEIIFLEDNDAYYFVDKGHVIKSQKDKFRQLQEKGYFDSIKGLIIGRTKTLRQVSAVEDDRLSEMASYKQEAVYINDIIMELIDKDIPILGNVSCSHTHPMVTLPLGRIVTLNADQQTLTIHPIESRS